TNDPTNRVDLLGQDFDDERTELLELVDGRRGARVIIGAELSAGFQVAWASSLTTGLWCGFGSYGYVPCDPPLGGGGLPLPGFGGGSGWLAGGGSGTWTCEEARASCNQTAMQYAKDCAEGFAIGAIQCEIACAAGCAPAALFTPLGYGSCFLACSARCATVAGIGSMHCVMEAMNMSKHCTDEYNACVARRNRRR
ncbi:MAG: hypothetical protein M1451_03070, partial [Acidobacteria bacterium]|nr:hypothetical protein [Acidobacteriota bacterium]